MPTRESYVPGTPSWVDLSTTDQDAAKRFYRALFGWTYDDVPAGDDAVYSMAMLQGATVAAIATQQPEQAALGVPPHWQMYITVDDLDAACERAGEAVHVPPFQIMEAGKMAVLTDPAGAFFMLWEPIEHVGAGLVNEHGTFIWSELTAPNYESTAEFYERVVGLQFLAVPMPDGSTYGGWTLDGTADTMVAGAMKPQGPPMPAHWNIYFACDDVDALVAKVAELGGAVHAEPFDIPVVGRLSVVADPQGAVFTLMQPAETTS